MLIVQKGNKQLKTDEINKEKFISEGWDIIDGEGNVIETGFSGKATEKEVVELKKKLKNVEDRLQESEKENDALVAKIQELEKAKK